MFALNVSDIEDAKLYEGDDTLMEPKDGDDNTTDTLNEDDEEKSDYDLLRERNIKALFALWSSTENEEDKELAEGLKSYPEMSDLFPPSKKAPPRSIKRQRKPDEDSPVYYRTSIPLERRKSNRIANLPVDTVYEGFADENGDGNIENLERIVFQPKKRRQSHPRQPLMVLTVEEVTDELLDNIAKTFSQKVYSATEGTTCHQCRQKTLDTKTVCRSGNCLGINGQFCGPCLRNRYGEEVADALKNPTWSCPFCQGSCNCSFCRGRAGKRATGQLAPIAHQRGFLSVKHLLEDLNGFGDYSCDEEDKNECVGFDGNVSTDCISCEFRNCNANDELKNRSEQSVSM